MLTPFSDIRIPWRGRPISAGKSVERRQYRRHEVPGPVVEVRRVLDDAGRLGSIGKVVDLSAAGLRLQTYDAGFQPGSVVDVRITLPDHAGISPFLRLDGEEIVPERRWTGAFEVLRRFQAADGTFDIGGRLTGLDEANRGMLGLYLSTCLLAA